MLALSFIHEADNTLAVVLINTSTSAKTVNLNITGAVNPSTFHAYRTSQTENVMQLADVGKTGISLPGNSVTTLYNGNAPVSVVAPSLASLFGNRLYPQRHRAPLPQGKPVSAVCRGLFRGQP